MTVHQRLLPFHRPRFYVWRRDILYLASGPSRPGLHRVAHDKLMVALAGSFRIRVGNQWLNTRSCLLATGVWQDPDRIDVSQAVTATWLLPPLSQYYPALASVMTPAAPGLHVDHPNEPGLIQRLERAATDPAPSATAVRQQLTRLLIPPEPGQQVFFQVDPRVVSVVRHIQQTASCNLPLTRFARDVGLSASYLEKLFKAQTGLPITRYRLRYRIYLASILLGMGYSITDAALRAGFASSSHFSRTYRALTGETASRMLLRSGAEILLERKVLRLILPLVRQDNPDESDDAHGESDNTPEGRDEVADGC